MGRELRMVPADWQHPKNEHGRYVPLRSGGFADADARWNEGYAKWQEGLVRTFGDDDWKPIDPQYLNMRFSDWDCARPSPDDYMPDWPVEQRTHFMMYEDTSEGTPISPAFATAEELARWLADNGASAFGDMTATYDQWLNTIQRGWAISAVRVNGQFISGVEAQ